MKKAFWLGLLLVPAFLQAADEDAMFGDGPSPTPGLTAGPSPEGEGRGLMDAFASGETKDDPLDIGGTLYQRLSVPFDRGLTEGQQSFSLPLQMDVYLDSRPNDRVRGYILGRLLYDSTRDAYGKATAGKGGGFSIPSGSTVTATPLPNNPQVVLDQAWLKFDVQRTAFISLGKQHVKWGTGRIWNPSDALNPQRRDPLQPYDLRLGSNMATLQLPWESKQANLYAIALFDNPMPASTLQQLGGAIRLEGLIGPAEIGLSAVGRANELPRYGADLSTPLGPFDAYAEAAFLSNDGRLANTQWLGLPASLSPTPTLASLYATNALPSTALQAVAGLSYTFAWRESRTATIGGEYFYNELGVTEWPLYPILLYQNRYTPFYVGKHYAALYIQAEGPDSGKKTNYTLSTLSNLSDLSAVSRLDFRWLALDYLSVGLYGSVNYGTRGGEFNFSLNTPALTDASGAAVPAINYAGTSGEAGASLRVGF